MKKFLVLSVLCSLIACSSSSATKEDKPEEQQPKNVYRNPVIDYSLPDPSVIEGDDGYYYLYATEDIRNLPIHRSKNLVDWEYVVLPLPTVRGLILSRTAVCGRRTSTR